MKTGKTKLVTIAVAFSLALVACDKHNNAEIAGKKIDQAAEKAGIKLDQASDNLSEQAAYTGVILEDSAITTKVKAAILREPGLRSLEINVDTVNGVVSLAGNVDTQANSDNTKRIAGSFSEVKQVNNRLQIK